MLRNALLTTTSLFLVAGLAACSSTRKTSDATIDTKTSTAASSVGAREYAVIEFKPGSSQLTESSREKLRSIAARVESARKVEDVKVLAWADREYPAEGVKASRSDVNVASARAEAIEDYLEDLNMDADVDTYNMAKRPNALSRVFNTEDNEIKSVFERSGAAPTDSGHLISGKASKALVLLDYNQ